MRPGSFEARDFVTGYGGKSSEHDKD